MKFLAPFLILMVPHFAFSQGQTCADSSTLEGFADCLNQKASLMLEEASKPSGRFSKLFDSIKHRYHLDHHAIPLSETFKIEVMEIGDPEISDQKTCFPGFLPGQSQANLQIEDHFLKQLDHLIGFLAVYHSASFGREVSVFFQIKSIRICDISQSRNRRMGFSNRLLRFGFDTEKIMTSGELATKWHSGDAIRLFDKGHFDGWFFSEDFGIFFDKREIMAYRHPEGGARAIVYDWIADKLWILLDPTGRERVGVSGLLAGKISKFMKGVKKDGEKLTHPEILNRLHAIATSGPGLNEKQLRYLQGLKNDSKTTREIYDQWLSQLGDLSYVYKLVENAAFTSQQGIPKDSGMTMIAMRDLHAKYNISNQHNISVFAANAAVPWDQLMAAKNNPCAPGSRKKVELTLPNGGTLKYEANACDNLTILADRSGNGFDDKGQIKGAKVGVATSDTISIETDIIGKVTEVLGKMDLTLIKRAALYQILEQKVQEGTANIELSPKP